MAIDKSKIAHQTECIPEIVRIEIYEYEDIVYKENFDPLTGDMMYGHVFMFNDVHVCTVYKNGMINLALPDGIAYDHRTMMQLSKDLKRLDDFLMAVVETYQ